MPACRGLSSNLRESGTSSTLEIRCLLVGARRGSDRRIELLVTTQSGSIKPNEEHARGVSRTQRPRQEQSLRARDSRRRRRRQGGRWRQKAEVFAEPSRSIGWSDVPTSLSGNQTHVRFARVIRSAPRSPIPPPGLEGAGRIEPRTSPLRVMVHDVKPCRHAPYDSGSDECSKVTSHATRLALRPRTREGAAPFRLGGQSRSGAAAG